MKNIIVEVFCEGVLFDSESFTSVDAAAGWASNWQDRGYRVRVR